MTSHELRQRFLDFFKARDHAVRPSDSLVPSDDPTVLFTSAGMNQFKPYFLGQRIDLTRAASSQKCLRTGDLDAVGDASHHSFFEMLGNFSFGDYSKREAIGWGWEFLTQELKLPKDKLWVSVFENDDEAAELWTRYVSKARIKRFGEADNFWPANAPTAGPNGPCGPCSEIYFDPKGEVDGKSSLEIWNLVFTQFDRQSDGTLKPLPRKNIDTGMGLERLTRVMRSAPTDYETDLFAPIVASVRRLPVDAARQRAVTAEQRQRAERAVADHLRGIVFCLADGVMPSNEGRGYILRMLIRRAYRYGVLRLGIAPAQAGNSPAVLWTQVDAVREAMRGSPYETDLHDRAAHIVNVLRGEEEQFAATLEDGNARLTEHLKQLRAQGATQISGDEAFKLYDTYGLPLEVTIDIASEAGLTVERSGFNAALKTQQTRSRQHSQFGGQVFVESYRQRLAGVKEKGAFVGYNNEQLKTTGTVVAIFRGGEPVQRAASGEDVDLVLNRTPFYGESGGQVGDAGTLEGSAGRAEVVDTQRADETIIHRSRVLSGQVQVGETLTATVDLSRRLAIARNHSATHILHSVLREVLGQHVQQCGSLVAPDRLRFDFSHPRALSDEEMGRIETLVNERIRQNDEVKLQELSLEEARKTGALAFFGDKYGSTVRVRTIGAYSKELCGGTHLARVGEIGACHLVSESSIAAGVRRIEAVTHERAAQLTEREEALAARVAQLKTLPPAQIAGAWTAIQREVASAEAELQLKRSRRMNALLDEANKIKALGERQERQSKQSASLGQVDALLANAVAIDGNIVVVAAEVHGVDQDSLRRFVDLLKEKRRMLGTIVVLGSGETCSVVVGSTPDVVQRGFHAGKFIQELVKLAGGSGGGRPEFAQGGVKDPSAIPALLAGAHGLIRKVLLRSA